MALQQYRCWTRRQFCVTRDDWLLNLKYPTVFSVVVALIWIALVSMMEFFSIQPQEHNHFASPPLKLENREWFLSCTFKGCPAYGSEKHQSIFRVVSLTVQTECTASSSPVHGQLLDQSDTGAKLAWNSWWLYKIRRLLWEDVGRY
jgi:hypothetical protein